MKTILLYLCLALFLFAAPGKIGAGETELPQESENFFNSFLFIDYLDQLQTFVLSKTELTAEEADFVTYIAAHSPGNAGQNRQFYHMMIDKLRLLINSKKTSEFTDHFCVWLFESVQMWDSITRFQNANFIPPTHYRDPMNLIDLFNLTHEIYFETLADERYNGCHKVSKETNDQMRFGNFPYLLFTMDKTKVIRIPCITKDVGDIIEMDEEFYHYLLVNRKNNKKHLYVNLLTQKYDKPNTGDPERRKTIEALENDPALRGSVFVVTLDKNSPFYYQSGPYETQDDASVFIDEFYSKMFSSSEAMFTFPKCLELMDWQICCEKLLHRIHTTYFDQKKTLTLDERKDFLHIAYLEMVKALVKRLKVDTLNVSCMNTVDRGISLLAELYLDHILKNPGVSIDQSMKNRNYVTRAEADRFISLILVHPIILRNRPAHDYRMERIISAILAMHSKSLQNLGR